MGPSLSSLIMQKPSGYVDASRLSVGRDDRGCACWLVFDGDKLIARCYQGLQAVELLKKLQADRITE